MNSVKLFLQHGNFPVAAALKSPFPSYYDLLMDPQEWLTVTDPQAVVGYGISSLEEGVPLTWRWSNLTAETVTSVCH